MKFSIVILSAAAGAVAFIGVARAATMTDRRPSAHARTTWDSVYSAAQASRGDEAYTQACAKCHGASLAGTDSASELSGESFLANWDGMTLNELYNKILMDMPPDSPNSIPRPKVAELVAFVLAKNGFPAGRGELAHDADSLKSIALLKARP